MDPHLRSQLRTEDLPYLKEIMESTGFFNEAELGIVQELAQQNLEKGEMSSGYFFHVIEHENTPVAFSCHGPISGTENSFDLYWLAVHNAYRGKGLGTMLLDRVVKEIRGQGGGMLWIETSSRPLYEPTRQFYLSKGCEQLAELRDFYARDDHKVVYRLAVNS